MTKPNPLCNLSGGQVLIKRNSKEIWREVVLIPRSIRYVPHIDDEVDVPLPFNDLNEDEMAPSCAACQLCCNPNSDSDDYCFCMNCNGEAHTICTEQTNFQTPASDKLVITHLEFCYCGKER